MLSAAARQVSPQLVRRGSPTQKELVLVDYITIFKTELQLPRRQFALEWLCH